MKTKNILITLFKIYLIPVFGLLLLTLFFVGCNEEENTSTPPPPSNPNMVSIINLSFNPSNRTISAGTTVTWTNNDNVAHTVTSGTPQNPSGVFDSGNIPPGGTFQFTFMQTGSFNYYCEIHTAMTAQITVQ